MLVQATAYDVEGLVPGLTSSLSVSHATSSLINNAHMSSRFAFSPSVSSRAGYAQQL